MPARINIYFFQILRKNNVITNIYLTDNLIKKFELFLIKNKQISKQSGRHDGTDGCRWKLQIINNIEHSSLGRARIQMITSDLQKHHGIGVSSQKVNFSYLR